MFSGVSPFGICHAISPFVRSIAAIVPYGGFRSGSPCTLTLRNPPNAPASRPVHTPCGITEPSAYRQIVMLFTPTLAVTKTIFVSGSNEPPGQLLPPMTIKVLIGPFGL